METKAILDSVMTLAGFTLTLLAASSIVWTYIRRSRKAFVLSLCCLVIPFVSAMATAALACLEKSQYLYSFLATIALEVIGVLGLTSSILFGAFNRLPKKKRFNRQKASKLYRKRREK